MPNASAPAAAEGVPKALINENRIMELAREISDLLDRPPSRDFVLIHAASRPQRHHIIMGGMGGEEFKPEVSIRTRPSMSKFISAQDRLNEALDFSRLVFNAIESMQLDNDMKAVSAGVYEIEKRLCLAKDLLEEAKDAIGKH